MALIKVDRQDKLIGIVDKEKAHQGKGILHRAFSILVIKDGLAHFSSRQNRRINSAIPKDQVELLLQKRSQYKKLWPFFWSNTCCSHLSVEGKGCFEPGSSDIFEPGSGREQKAFGKGELIKQAERRLEEEMGFTVPLKEIGKLYYQAQYKDVGSEHEITHLLLGKYDGQEIKPDPQEAADYRWLSLVDLKKEIKNKPEEFTPWFKKIIEIFGNSNFSCDKKVLAKFISRETF